ncbi:MAG: hypothetical protein JWN02_973 [Acidobacteria bacterium]|nr:hypothetical protein [Acidobacteriota bacterium]
MADRPQLRRQLRSRRGMHGSAKQTSPSPVRQKSKQLLVGGRKIAYSTKLIMNSFCLTCAFLGNLRVR